MSKEHKVKSWTWFFQAISKGDKLHDLRKNDRDFKVGDTLLLQEYDPVTGTYTGQELKVKITYITSNEFPCAFSSSVLPHDYCILSIRNEFGPIKITSQKGEDKLKDILRKEHQSIADIVFGPELEFTTDDQE